MRISDWSSDVCSSDLHRCANVRPSADTRHELADVREGGEVDPGKSGPADDGEEIGVRGGEAFTHQERAAPGEVVLDEGETLGDLRPRRVLRPGPKFGVAQPGAVPLVQLGRDEEQPAMAPVTLRARKS